MIQLKSIVMVGLVFVNSALAFAGDGKGDWKGGDKPGTVGKVVTLEELRERCAHPDQFDVQRPPQNIRIQCSDSRVTWAATQAGEVPLPAERKIGVSVFSDKFFVSQSESAVPFFTKSGSCLRFQEVRESFTIERPLSCDELLGMKHDLADFCSEALDYSKDGNSKLVERVETGRVMDTCAGAQMNTGKPGPK